MDQQSLQALLQELRGLDSPPPADEEAAGRVPFARNKSAEDAGAVSDYAAWYEDYVKAQSTSSATEKVPRESIKQVATSPAAQPGPASDEARDPRKLTYAQALPIISKLAADNAFLEALQELKSNQEKFELALLDERNRSKHDLEKQLKAAREAAAVTGSQYEVDRISKLLTATVSKFDKAALSRWDNLARDQQARLEQSPDPVAQERQRRVMETLVTLLSEI